MEVICCISLVVIYIVKELQYRGHGGFDLHCIDWCCVESPGYTAMVCSGPSHFTYWYNIAPYGLYK